MQKQSNKNIKKAKKNLFSKNFVFLAFSFGVIFDF